jgi:DNA polymerase V
MEALMAVVVDIAKVLSPFDDTAGILVSPVGVAAGFPSPAQDYFDGRIDLNAHLIRDITSTFIVRVAGDSMRDAGISDGDEVIVDRSIEPRDGVVVVAVVDGELTLKRLSVLRDRVVLRAENPRYPDIVVASLSELTIWGVVTRCLHRV